MFGHIGLQGPTLRASLALKPSLAYPVTEDSLLASSDGRSTAPGSWTSFGTTCVVGCGVEAGFD
jgi:hypothetical protein